MQSTQIVAASFTELAALQEKQDRENAVRHIVFNCGSPVEDFVTRALGALVSISEKDDNRQLMVDEGVVSILVRLCERDSTKDLGDISIALLNLAEDEDHRSVMV